VQLELIDRHSPTGLPTRFPKPAPSNWGRVFIGIGLDAGLISLHGRPLGRTWSPTGAIETLLLTRSAVEPRFRCRGGSCSGVSAPGESIARTPGLSLGDRVAAWSRTCRVAGPTQERLGRPSGGRSSGPASSKRPCPLDLTVSAETSGGIRRNPAIFARLAKRAGHTVRNAFWRDQTSSVPRVTAGRIDSKTPRKPRRLPERS
jgi:hypothetical protein